MPFTIVGAELLFEVLSQRYEHGGRLITSNLPFDEWTGVFGSQHLTGAILDRLTHHVHIPKLNADSFRLANRPQAPETTHTRQWRCRLRQNQKNPSADRVPHRGVV